VSQVAPAPAQAKTDEPPEPMSIADCRAGVDQVAPAPTQQAAPEPAPASKPEQAATPAPAPKPNPKPKPEPRPHQQTASQQPTGAAAKLPDSGTVQGIDVSHWQGDIDWQQVRQDGVRVAYLKATEHTSFVDKSFTENRAGAKAAGVVTGSYHFAQPGRDGGSVKADARAEADHFLEIARPRDGELVPVLDLEANNGLSRAELATWVKTWLDRVADATGTKPMIYTSPSFWSSNVDDMLGIADTYPLWVAHWGVDSPTVPGSWDAWQGWQKTSSGSVDGIDGRVDRDTFRAPGRMLA
jgi:GH25 family lysozyme M1 (1,4-beta-N-acetylmuramidase)